MASHRSATPLQGAARVDRCTWHGRPAANPARCAGKTPEVNASKEVWAVRGCICSCSWARCCCCHGNTRLWQQRGSGPSHQCAARPVALDQRRRAPLADETLVVWATSHRAAPGQIPPATPRCRHPGRRVCTGTQTKGTRDAKVRVVEHLRASTKQAAARRRRRARARHAAHACSRRDALRVPSASCLIP